MFELREKNHFLHSFNRYYIILYKKTDMLNFVDALYSVKYLFLQERLSGRKRWKINCFALLHLGRQIETQRTMPKLKSPESDFLDFRNVQKERARRGICNSYYLLSVLGINIFILARHVTAEYFPKSKLCKRWCFMTVIYNINHGIVKVRKTTKLI